MYHVEINRSLCSGIGKYAELAARSSGLGPDGVPVTYGVETDEDAILGAEASCPMGAIAAYDEHRRRAA